MNEELTTEERELQRELPELPQPFTYAQGEPLFCDSDMRLYVYADRSARAVESEMTVPPLPEMEGLGDIPYACDVPKDWDIDYRHTWQKLQVAERNKTQWRAYALLLRDKVDALLFEVAKLRAVAKQDGKAAAIDAAIAAADEMRDEYEEK